MLCNQVTHLIFILKMQLRFLDQINTDRHIQTHAETWTLEDIGTQKHVPFGVSARGNMVARNSS